MTDHDADANADADLPDGPLGVVCADCGRAARLTRFVTLFGSTSGFPDDATDGEDMWLQFEEGWVCYDDAVDRLGMADYDSDADSDSE